LAGSLKFGHASASLLVGKLFAEAGPVRLRKALHQLDDARLQSALVAVEPGAIKGLKFGDLLPAQLAVDTMSQRLLDRDAARFVARRRCLTEPASESRGLEGPCRCH
jgi:hypothetical protein